MNPVVGGKANWNPARIPPQTPPAGGKSAEAKRKILFPRKFVFSLCRVRIEASPPARSIEGRDPQKNVLFHLEEKIGRAQKEISGEHFSAGHASGASGGGADSFVQFPLEKSSRKVYNYSTRKEFASLKGSLPAFGEARPDGRRFARQPVCIEFSGQKRIGDFERRKENLLIKKFIFLG